MGGRDEIEQVVVQMAQRARAAARRLGLLSTQVKNDALHRMADALEGQAETLREANNRDLEEGERRGLSSALLDRLSLTSDRIAQMADGVCQVAGLPDPVGEWMRLWTRPNGLRLAKVRVPIGVIGIIYESRPNVTADAAALCLKSGNAVILRGGSEAIHSNRAIVEVLTKAAEGVGVPEGSIQLIPITDRSAVTALLKLDRYVDLIVPRGGESLIRMVVETSTIPVIKHDRGLCHIYVDEFADQAMARRIVLNAKAQRPSVCNAVETLLVHRAAAPAFLPPMVRDFEEAEVEVRGCEETRRFVPSVRPATEEDWDTEYLDLIISVRVVADLGEALAHIEQHSSQLSEAIVTENYSRAMEFIRSVDSAAVYVNASTRLTDGYEFGLGAELGISTQKLHCRGPMGLEELTTYKYIGLGSGQIRL